MVLELKIPAEPTLRAVLDVLPFLAAYLLAFIYVAIYWNNHHHMMQSAHKVTGAVLWANHALLFWLTLFPLMIRWIDEAGVHPLAGRFVRHCPARRVALLPAARARSDRGRRRRSRA